MNDMPDATGGRNFVGNRVNAVYYVDYLFLVAPTAKHVFELMMIRNILNNNVKFGICETILILINLK